MCDTWADHSWSRTFVGTGTHPTRGSYITYALVCDCCGRRQHETVWAPSVAPHVVDAQEMRTRLESTTGGRDA